MYIKWVSSTAYESPEMLTKLMSIGNLDACQAGSKIFSMFQRESFLKMNFPVTTSHVNVNSATCCKGAKMKQLEFKAI